MSGGVVHPVALRELTVARVVDLGPRLRRVTLVGDQLRPFSREGFALPGFVTEAPDDHVKLFPPPPDGSPVTLPGQADGHLVWPDDHSVVSRDYTVRRWDAEVGELDIDLVLHDGGVVSGWAARVEPGDTIHVAGPRSSAEHPAAATLVLACDLTGLPAVARWVEEAPTATDLTVIVGAVDPSDHVELRRGDGTPVEVRWVHDGDAVDLVGALRALPALPEDVYVFVASELSDVAAARRHLRDERGLPRHRWKAVSYWRRGGSAEADHVSGHVVHAMADVLTPMAIRVAATLRLPDLIAAGTTTPSALAEAAGADPVTVAALVAHLVSKDVLSLSDDGTIGLTGLGAALTDDHDSGLRRSFDLTGAEGRMEQAWAGLLHTATTGTPGYRHLFGAGFWDDLQADERLGRTFDGYLARWASTWVPLVVAAHDWTAHRRIVDVGGGVGLLLAEVLRAAPDAEGVLVELPDTAARAETWFAHQGVATRAATAAGSFFDPLPRGDAVVLAQVLHDWPDDEAARILARAAEALEPGGRVVIVERLDSDGGGEAVMTLLMRNLFAGTERTHDDFVRLASEVGLVPVAATDAGVGLHVLVLEAAG